MTTNEWFIMLDIIGCNGDCWQLFGYVHYDMMALIEECNTNCILWTMYRQQEAYGNDHGHYCWMLQDISQVAIFSVEDNHRNSCRYSPLLFIFDCLFFSPLISWLFALISFNFHLHVMLLLPSLSFFLSMFLWSIPFFYVEWMCLSLKLNNNYIQG